MSRYKIPPSFRVPESTPHLEAIIRAYSPYQDHPEWWNPTPFSLEDYLLICKYADFYGDPVWQYIVKGGVQGVSLIYHEAAEFEWYCQKGLDPFGRIERQDENPKREKQEYEQAHPVGLINEHRYLEEWAHRDGLQVRLGELIRWNPGSGYPKFDLGCIVTDIEQPIP